LFLGNDASETIVQCGHLFHNILSHCHWQDIERVTTFYTQMSRQYYLNYLLI